MKLEWGSFRLTTFSLHLNQKWKTELFMLMQKS